MKYKLSRLFIFFGLVLLCQTETQAGIQNHWQKKLWLFRLSLSDYEIKSQGVLEAEAQEQESEMSSENPTDDPEVESLLTSNEEILMINADNALSPGESIDEQERPKNFYTIPDLNQYHFNFGTYETEGFVVYIYHCKCPKGAICKPCMEKNVIISVNSVPKSGYDLTSDDIILFSDEVSQFDLGAKYRFVIQILDVKSTGQILNNIKLLYYEKLKS